MAGQKRPRQYAQEIIALKSREERAAALNGVPEHLKPMVRITLRTPLLGLDIKNQHPSRALILSDKKPHNLNLADP